MSRTPLSTFANGIGKSLRTYGKSIANERFLVFPIAAAVILSAGVSHNRANCIAIARPHIALCIALSFAHLGTIKKRGEPREEGRVMGANRIGRWAWVALRSEEHTSELQS